jgi:Arc/MetJ family transcription regulator
LTVDSKLLEQAVKLSGVKSKTEAINLALSEFVRQRERELLRAELGTFDLDLTADEVRELRRAS